MQGSMRLAKNTMVTRATLKREISCILEPDAEGCTRRVTVLLPAGSTVFIAPDIKVMQVADNSVIPVEGLDYDDGIGPNETFRLPSWPEGGNNFIWLMPGQSLYGATITGLVFASLVVEYWK
jgi:hypothetical protein